MDTDFVKITNVAYKLLDFFPDNDPLKNRAKQKVLAIMEHVVLASHESDIERKTKTQLLQDIEVLETYFKLARYQGWIDDINCIIIIKEYQKIQQHVISLKVITEKPIELPIKKEASNELVNKKEATPKIVKNIPFGEYTERQKRIIQILKGRQKAQVADIIKELPNVTKRTIRRDLDDLLKKGSVVRSGEWNQVVYSLGGGVVQMA